jgi:hypothetical protein
MLPRPLALLVLSTASALLAAAAPPLPVLRRRALATTTAGAVQWPVELQNLTWTSERGAILLNGRQFHLKGINWFGAETESTRCVSWAWG